jgi:O-antigen/teichoic acid export membrane protein
MGIQSISQVVTSSFLPALSHVQDDAERFSRVSTKMNRFTAYLLMPALGFLIVTATPIFHCLFGTKWDPSILLFQLLLLRGVFTVLTSLYNNYLIALAKTRTVMAMESLRDGAALLFLIATLPVIAMTTETDSVYGIKILLYGQLLASALTWVVMLAKVAPITTRSIIALLSDLAPYTIETVAIGSIMWAESFVIANCWALLAVQLATGLALYLSVNALLGSAIQREVLAFVLHKKQVETK